MESVGDVRYHPAHCGHQTPGKIKGLKALQDGSDH